ncbi:MAG TPA: hypothetical protein VI461_11095 [Chitinophagaceae bacterium]|nr:hypothetical protein [Chitinophagaceae bacterium]
MKKIPSLLLATFVAVSVFSQTPQFSLASDVSLLRSFKKDQRYWSIGQTVNFHFHFTSKDGVYAWISYYSNGKFKNDLAATAKQPATTPQQLNYRNSAELRFKHISLGWRKYLKGAFNTEKGWNLYSYAGFGLMIGSVVNTHSVGIDTSLYIAPVSAGKANFKRLTLDLGLGIEWPVGGDIFIYFEGRALVPTTDYPSKYLFVNSNAPFTAAANAGLRILFN